MHTWNNTPAVPRRSKDAPQPRCPHAWWTNAPRTGFTRLAEAQKARQSRGVTYYADLGDALAVRANALRVGKP